ncbi:MAG TPA: dolichyl-phosphate beta-glucosyltransferase [Kofleriaceae bacterium]|jgi:glycosyltransferase involved in cell wall biosynthesis|nr:dolichyl-phosphate beta-glucosyltransferase [Kofleriaceae bacterium]
MSTHTLSRHLPLTTDLDLSIVIPAYNEEQRITPTLAALDAFLAAHPWSYELVVVDDGSRDGTVALCQRLAAERMPRLRVIATSPNRGKGHAVRAGMLAARGAVRVMCDADGSMPATELPKLLAPIADGRCAIAIGSRYARGASAHTQPLWRRAWSRLCNRVIQKTLVPGVRDTQCGFKAFTALAAHDLFARATIDGWAFDLEVLALAKRLGHEVAEVGVAWTDDRRSRVNPLKDLWKVVREAVTIKRNLRRGAYGPLLPAAR